MDLTKYYIMDRVAWVGWATVGDCGGGDDGWERCGCWTSGAGGGGSGRRRAAVEIASACVREESFYYSVHDERKCTVARNSNSKCVDMIN